MRCFLYLAFTLGIVPLYFGCESEPAPSIASSTTVASNSSTTETPSRDKGSIRPTRAPSLGSYALAIHGGAGNIADLGPDERALYTRGLAKALRTGQKMLEDGKSSLDVVEAVVAELEDDPLFNAGRGAVFNAKGEHELDASIMDGSTKKCGAVAGARTTKNPIHAARAVMEKTDHIILSGAGADTFAQEQKLEQVKNDYFSTEARRGAWQKLKEGKHGTVGAVALDKAGHLAAATSTGGLTNKQWGRIGDSPIVGAGTYADDESCAVSSTGKGEEFIRNAIAFSVSARMKWLGESAQSAASHVIHDVLKPGQGGVIVVSRTGDVVFSYNTSGMFRGAATSDGRLEVFITDQPESLR